MSSNVRTCHTAHTYEWAHAHFERTPEVEARSRGALLFTPIERPLGDNRQWHYRIKRGSNAEYYDVNLYHTTMARYYRPDVQGNRRVCYVWDNRSTSVQFMHHVVGVSKVEKYYTPEGKRVCVPIGTGESYNRFSTDLTFDKDGKLILEQSSHAQIQRRVVTPEIKAWRRHLRERTKTLFTLLELGGLPGYTVDRKTMPYGQHPGKPFAENKIASSVYYALRRTAWAEELPEETPEDVVEELRILWNSCAVHAAQKRDYVANHIPRYGRDKREPVPEGPIDPRGVTRAALTALYRVCPHEKAREDVPAFPEEMSKSWIF